MGKLKQVFNSLYQMRDQAELVHDPMYSREPANVTVPMRLSHGLTGKD